MASESGERSGAIVECQEDLRGNFGSGSGNGRERGRGDGR